MFKVVEAAMKIGELKIPDGVLIDVEKAKDWLSKGVQPTETVRNLLVKTGAMEKPTKLSPSKTKTKKSK